MRSFASVGLALAVAGPLALLAGACEPELGEVPATCPEGTCPEGYDCIHGVCARPGTAIPVSVEATDFIRASDLVVVPEDGSVLVVWETYAYSSEGQSIRARRLFPDGSVSDVMVLEDTWVASEAGLEPYFDVIGTSQNQALLAIASGTIDDAPEPRVRVYRVELPASGDEGAPVISEPAWDAEVRMATLGYGGVSRPHFLRRSEARVELGYFQSLAQTAFVDQGGGGAGGGGQQGVTLGELAVFELELSGEVAAAPPPCPLDGICCPASTCTGARADRTLAVGVAAGYPAGEGVTWVLDDERPSALLVADGVAQPEELALPNLCAPVGVASVGGSDDALLVLVPSERTGDKLPSDPVAGPARLRAHTPAGEQDLAELPTMHDNPRPATLRWDDATVVIATPGASAESATLTVYSVDIATGQHAVVGEIPRFSSQPVGVVRLASAAGKLFVVWLDEGDDAVTIRAATLDPP